MFTGIIEELGTVRSIERVLQLFSCRDEALCGPRASRHMQEAMSPHGSASTLCCRS